jgi:hypothetical protein
VGRSGRTQWDLVSPCHDSKPADAVEVLVIGDDERPIGDLEVVLGSPSAGHQRDVTDARGRCRFEGLAPGESTTFSIPTLDADAWELVRTFRLAPKSAASHGDPSTSVPAPTPRPPTTHDVKPGECLYEIGYAHGFLPETLWQHNAASWGPHDSKGVIPPGLALQIPMRRVGVAVVPSGHLAVVHRIGIPVVMTLRVVDARGRTWNGCPYVLTLRGPSGPIPNQVGITDSAGRLHVPVRPDVTHGKLRIGSAASDRQWVVNLSLGTLQPADTPEGATARLWNLGYRGASNRLWREDDVLATFQHEALESEPGPLDRETADALRKQHES